MELTEENRLRRRLAPANRFIGCVVACALMLLVVVAPGQGKLSTPRPTSPPDGAVFPEAPPFTWTAVAGAEQYEFQLAADAGMNSSVLGRGKDRFRTKNLSATVTEAIPDGNYYWRVRGITKSGSASDWSRPRTFKKDWADEVPLDSPANEAVVVYPTTPLRLTWAPVPRAASYLVSIATDQSLGSLIGGKPVETFATSFTPTDLLASGKRYYWGVTPVDAQGHRGRPSDVRWFTWVWPSTTKPRWRDLLPDVDQVFDVELAWDPVPGAARYEVEVNPTQEFAPGSKVCCGSPTIATSLSPSHVLKDNRYYWRVRAIDADGNAGVWNSGDPKRDDIVGDWHYGWTFDKRFDKVPPVNGASIKNLHMRDHLGDPGLDLAPGILGYQTHVPIVTWDAVPGASSYLLELARFNADACEWANNPMLVSTVVPAWTPLGPAGNTKPYPDSLPVQRDGRQVTKDSPYCVRVRARTDRDIKNEEVYGDFTYLDDGSGSGFAFTWVTGPPDGAECSSPCVPGYLGRDDYVLPEDPRYVPASVERRTPPLFIWKPLAGKQSYFIIVARDSNFSNIVDYAFTQVPAYAPRGRTYPDEVTAYYWVVLPASAGDGSDAVGNPLRGESASFNKNSIPPSLIGVNLNRQPTFRWSLPPAEGALQYRLQVSQDPTFINPIEDVTTDSTAYTSDTTYPADVMLYWRVRADAENLIGIPNLIGLNWSLPGTFTKTLPAPQITSGNPSQGDFIPTWAWDDQCLTGACAAGAVSYDVTVGLPNGTRRELKGLRTATLTPTVMYGTGKFSWQVRANFPTPNAAVVPGPYTQPPVEFTRTIPEVDGAHAISSKKQLLFAWDPKPGVKGYRVEISNRKNFTSLIESGKTDNTSYAARMMNGAYATAPVLYWHVAAVDEGNNVGDYTPVRQLRRAQRMFLIANAKVVRGRKVTVMMTVVDARKRPLQHVAVRIRGAGVRPAAKRTDRRGKVPFTVKATRRGTVLWRATKTGYEPGVLQQRVR